jgi:deazaflavin-dependent oxidoreductase (nitroreductase family)
MTTIRRASEEGSMLYGQEHVRRYRETDGEVGYLWRGVPTLILTTTGRRSGRQRPTPLIFGRDGDDCVVVASKGGAPAHPAWYRNLVDHPEVEVQVKGERFRARARTADGEERARLWRLMTGIWPAYDQYQQRTDRRIPVVVLEQLPS